MRIADAMRVGRRIRWDEGAMRSPVWLNSMTNEGTVARYRGVVSTTLDVISRLTAMYRRHDSDERRRSGICMPIEE